MEIRPIEFQFKGARTYIHGTDVFNAMLETHAGSEIRNIRFSVHDFIRTPVCRLYSAGTIAELSGVNDIRARCQFSAGGAMHYLALTPGEGDANSGGRYEYDEGKIVSLCRTEGEQIFLLRESPFTYIESIVAMNKNLHQQLFPNASGHWIFTRLDMDAGCDSRADLALQFRHNMNFRLTKSEILVREKKIGDLYFSLVTR